MWTILLIILIVLLLGGGGGYYGGRAFIGPDYGYHGGIVTILVVLLVLWLLGAFR